MFRKISEQLTFSNLTLLTALTLSTIAAWFAIVGLIAIFPARATAIIVMGSAIEFGKVVATVWLRRYWTQCGWQFKTILVPMVAVLMLLTSMGTFGFLSAAHTEHSLASGDSGAKVAILDERIKTQRENIEVARKALAQLDAQVDARLSRGDSEAGAERAVQIRRQQAGERAKLSAEITAAQTAIAKLNEERAPLAADQRKIEAEVGPIKYIAALVYGDNPDANVLERAVRWVIILLVIVFDPLAIALVLAGNSSKEWDKRVEDDRAAMGISPPHDVETRAWTQQELDALDGVNKPITTPWPTEWTQYDEPKEQAQDSATTVTKEEVNALLGGLQKAEQDQAAQDEFDISKHPYLFKGGFGFKNDVPIQVYRPEISENQLAPEPQGLAESTEAVAVANPEPVAADAPISSMEASVDSDAPIVTEGVTTDMEQPPYVESQPGYVIYDGKQMSREALRGLRPELFAIRPDIESTTSGFGTEFPRTARRGDTWVRVDVLPNRVYKFDGARWIEIQKAISDSYIQNPDYLQYLIRKIDSGEYDVDLLTDAEREQISDYLRTQKS